MGDPVDGGPGRDRLTEEVDVRAARITACGQLGLRGAELLAATVGQLRRTGARCVVVDMSAVSGADPAAVALLTGLQRRIAGDGARLVLSGLRGDDEPVAAVPGRG
jgi:anti-anti-sigma regulatory factor